MDLQDVQRVLDETGALLELKGENIYKARSYTQAARVLEMLEKDINEAIEDGSLERLPGIGPVLAGKIETLVHTGTLPLHERLRSEIPPGLISVMAVPGLGARKARALYDHLGITDLASLEAACRNGQAERVPGFGTRTQERILRELDFRRRGAGQKLLPEALALAAPVIAALSNTQGVQSVWVVGGGRRRAPVVDDVDLLVVTASPGGMEKVLPGLPSVISAEPAKSSFRRLVVMGGLPVDVRWCHPEESVYALHHFTGSSAHLKMLCALARNRGIRLDEHGLFKDGAPVPCMSEEEIYGAMELPHIPPEIREGSGEFRPNAFGELLAQEDLSGMIHVHTDWSDGTAPLESLAARCKEMGFEYLVVSDHSQSAFYAGGLRPERVEMQWREIDRVNASLTGFRILRGIESDIRPDGSLDYPDELLAGFDVVIGSIHSHFKMERERMTARVLRAMEHPMLDILAHPTGRLLLHRSGYEIDLDAVLDQAVLRGVVLELNCNPHRLDLDPEWCRKACGRGIVISLGVDAHSIGELEHLTYGVWAARRGWLEAGNILNCLGAKEMMEALRRGRAMRGGG